MLSTPTMTEDAIRALEHRYIGPTWQTNPDGTWKLPEHSLGWAVVLWCTTYLKALDGSGAPWRFTDEQLRFIFWWYAVDARGRFVYRTGVLQRLKGWGKDPLLAVICLVELCGPCRFGGWGDDGEPVAVPHRAAWVQIAAVNQAQTRNTMTLMPSLISDLMRETYDIKDGAEIIRANGGRCRLEAVTSSYRALEGGRSTFVVLNESHHWIQGNGGIDMYETIDGNATKSAGGAGRYLAITNAYLPGEDSVAERMRSAYEAVVDGRAVDVGFLYDSVEANELTPLSPEALRIVIPVIRGDAHWLDVETIINSVLNTTMSPQRSRRMWLNQIVTGDDALYTENDYRECSVEDVELQPGDKVCLGFDGGKSDDATALVAIRISDMTKFVLHLQEKPDGPTGEGWLVDRAAVDSAVHLAHRVYDVKAFFADVALWESYIDNWAEQYGETYDIKASEKHAIAWDMRQGLQKLTRMHERFMQAILDRAVRFQSDRNIRRHLLNVFRSENIHGVSFRKESRESPRKVDIYAAGMLAYEAVHEYRTRRKTKTTKKRTGYGAFF